MNIRQARLLQAIIDEFIRTAIPVGSQQIIERGFLPVSGATVRNEMQVLCSEGFIEQPHVSAGRVPTVKGYRVYVQQFMDPSAHERTVRGRFSELKEQYFRHKDRERVYEAVAMLSNMVPNVTFATVPHREQVYYLGLSNAMRQPEFLADNRFVSGVVEVLEKQLTSLLSRVELSDKIQYFVGDKNLCPQFTSCSLMVTTYRIRDQAGVIGILGPVRMDYAYNTVALDMVAELLRDA